ncbi:hypothetical protein IQ06DRAFT_27393 [Phaeosphaeriaceae sp. SRC1lsM3a]|nr:hypothetical protein IQ06DRAFT_27393 [Stagonospora sp. SRC1lsM3a]
MEWLLEQSWILSLPWWVPGRGTCPAPERLACALQNICQDRISIPFGLNSEQGKSSGKQGIRQMLGKAEQLKIIVMRRWIRFFSGSHGRATSSVLQATEAPVPICSIEPQISSLAGHQSCAQIVRHHDQIEPVLTTASRSGVNWREIRLGTKAIAVVYTPVAILRDSYRVHLAASTGR